MGRLVGGLDPLVSLLDLVAAPAQGTAKPVVQRRNTALKYFIVMMGFKCRSLFLEASECFMGGGTILLRRRRGECCGELGYGTHQLF